MKNKIINWLNNKWYKENLDLRIGMLLSAFLTIIFLIFIALSSVPPKDSPSTLHGFIIASIISSSLFLFCLLSMIFFWAAKKFVVKQKNKQDKEDNERARQITKLAEEQRKIQRMNKDLVLKKVNDWYTVELVNGAGEILVLMYNSKQYDFANLTKQVKSFNFRSVNYESSFFYKFPESALPTLKLIIEHCQLYGINENGNINPKPDEITILETFIIERPPIEEPPVLTGLNTVEELVPLLITAEREQDHKAVNKILDKIEILTPLKLT